jgi:hypothetical protein
LLLEAQLGLLAGVQIWRDQFFDMSLAFIIIRDDVGSWGDVVSLEWDVGPEVVDLPFFFDFVDRRRRILVQDNTGMSPNRRATAICASLRAASQQAC